MCSLYLTHPSAHTPGAVGSGCWGFSALLKGLTSVVDNSCQDSNPQHRVTSPTLYPLEPWLPHIWFLFLLSTLTIKVQYMLFFCSIYQIILQKIMDSTKILGSTDVFNVVNKKKCFLSTKLAVFFTKQCSFSETVVVARKWLTSYMQINQRCRFVE